LANYPRTSTIAAKFLRSHGLFFHSSLGPCLADRNRGITS
jgi:hypothetical protein